MKENNGNHPANDIYGTWNGKQFSFTLNQIREISGGKFDIPEQFQKVANKTIRTLAEARYSKVTPTELGSVEKQYIQKKIKGGLGKLRKQSEPALNGMTVLFILYYKEDNMPMYVQYAKNGAVVFSCTPLKDANGASVPCIVLPSEEAVQEVWDSLGAYMKQVFVMPTIAVTGSVGKTTAVLFMQEIFEYRHRVFVSGFNRNHAAAIVSSMVRRYGPDYDYHLQETGGGGPMIAERSARMLRPDAFCILNVLPHHLDKYKNIEGVLYDKTSLDRWAKDGAFGVINLDDDMLRGHTFQHRVVTCGIQHKEADYVAENIRQEGVYLTLDVVHNGVRVPLKINIPGVHNAYNALHAFAMAKEMGLSDEEIQGGLLAYRSGKIRQNLREISGRIFYIDCYNVSADSIRSCLKTLDTIEVKPGNRRIAVINGENALGDKAYELSYELGKTLAEFHADEFIFVGMPENATQKELNYYGHGRAVYDGAKEVIHDRPVSFFDDLGQAADKLRLETKPGDVILLKGIFRLPLFALPDRAFGTDYVVKYPHFKGEELHENGMTARYFKQIGGSNLIKCAIKGKTVKLPDAVGGKPLARVDKKSITSVALLDTAGAIWTRYVRGKKGTGNIHRAILDGQQGKNPSKGIKSCIKHKTSKNFTDIDFGNACKAIGDQCFRGCRGLKSLHIGPSVLHIGDKAFAECVNLETVQFDGVEHIETDAFRGCKNLKLVVLPETCVTIEENAFRDCPKLKIKAAPGSYAAAYAEKNGIGLA